jgi:hypothetical protein
LSTFYSELLTILHSLRVERDHRALLVVQKRAVCPFADDSLEGQLLQVVTPFAFSMMTQHLSSYRDVRIESDNDNGSCHILSSHGSITTTCSSCCCLFRSSTGLPCRHIFAVRLRKQVALFDCDLIPARWSRLYYKTHHSVLESEPVSLEGSITLVTSQRPAVLSQNQKFRQAAVVANGLAALVSEAPTRLYEERLNQMKLLLQAWKDDRFTTVRVSTNDVSDIVNDSVLFLGDDPVAEPLDPLSALADVSVAGASRLFTQ